MLLVRWYASCKEVRHDFSLLPNLKYASGSKLEGFHFSPSLHPLQLYSTTPPPLPPNLILWIIFYANIGSGTRTHPNLHPLRPQPSPNRHLHVHIRPRRNNNSALPGLFKWPNVPPSPARPWHVETRKIPLTFSGPRLPSWLSTPPSPRPPPHLPAVSLSRCCLVIIAPRTATATATTNTTTTTTTSNPGPPGPPATHQSDYRAGLGGSPSTLLKARFINTRSFKARSFKLPSIKARSVSPHSTRVSSPRTLRCARTLRARRSSRQSCSGSSKPTTKAKGESTPSPERSAACIIER